MFKDKVINPIKSIFPDRTTAQTRLTIPASATSQISKPSKRKVAGVYEHRQGGVIYRRVLRENGIMEYYLHNKKAGESRWSEKNDEIIITTSDDVTVTEFLKLEPNGDLSWIAVIRSGARREIETLTFKKIK